MKGHLQCPGVRVVAVCDLNEERLGLGVKAAGDSSIATYRDYRRLLDDQNIDAVIVATNDHRHCACTIDACRAGKHVYVEKPLGTSIAAGTRSRPTSASPARKNRWAMPSAASRHTSIAWRRTPRCFLIRSAAAGDRRRTSSRATSPRILATL